MNTIVYKYRQCFGIIEYEVLNGEFGVDSTLHLRDTSCTHPGPKCEIEVTKSDDGNCYHFSKALNPSAAEYIYFHRVESFWATKEDAYVEGLRLIADGYRDSIDSAEKGIVKNNEELKGLQEKGVNFFNTTLAKLDSYCYVENEGRCRIIGTINFSDGTTGYLTDDNYSEDRWDSYGGDRIILKEKDNTGRIITERGDVVYLSQDDYKNHKTNNTIKKLTAEVERYKKAIGGWIKRIERINDIIRKRKHLTIDLMMEMFNEI
jgi:hypothetical protein